MRSESGIIDRVFGIVSQIWMNALDQAYEPVKIRRGYWEIYFGEWIVRKYVWGQKVRFEIESDSGQTFIEKYGDVFISNGDWGIIQEFLNWAEENGLI